MKPVNRDLQEGKTALSFAPVPSPWHASRRSSDQRIHIAASLEPPKLSRGAEALYQLGNKWFRGWPRFFEKMRAEKLRTLDLPQQQYGKHSNV